MTRTVRALLFTGLAWTAQSGAKAIPDAPTLSAAQSVAAEAPAPFECPPEGRIGRDAPPDYHEGPDARCVAAGSLVVLYGEDGKPLSKMTRAGPGMYFSAAGYRLADDAFRAVQHERNTCREELAARREVPLPGVPVAPPMLAADRGWPTGVVIAVGVAGVLVGGVAACFARGGCR